MLGPSSFFVAGINALSTRFFVESIPGRGRILRLALLLTCLRKDGRRAADRHQNDDGNGEYGSKDHALEHLLPLQWPSSDCAKDWRSLIAQFLCELRCPAVGNQCGASSFELRHRQPLPPILLKLRLRFFERRTATIGANSGLARPHRNE